MRNRVGSGNKVLDLTEMVQQETLTNISVHPEAAIWETGKLRFHDDGHDHTGGDEGALIEFTANLVSNSQFDRAVSPSGYPDHWIPTGYAIAPLTMHREIDGGYFGSYSCLASGVPNRLLPNDPWSIPHMYQNIPAPSGTFWSASPSGRDFDDRLLTVGVYARGIPTPPATGVSILIGLYSDGFGYIWEQKNITGEYGLYKHTFSVDNVRNSLAICLAPSGKVWFDNCQASLGRRLPATIPRYNERDMDSWNRQIEMYNNVSAYNIAPGHVLIYDKLNNSAVTHSTKYGLAAAGVAIAPNSPVSGTAVPVCVYGPTDILVYGATARGDLLYTSNIAGYPGYAISDTYISTFSPNMTDTVPFARALEPWSDQSPGMLTGMVVPALDMGGTGGTVIDLTWAPNIDVNMGGFNTFRCTLEGNTTFDAIEGTASTTATFIIKNDGREDWIFTMGENFISNGVLVSSKGEVTTVVLQYDGVYWWETSRTYGGKIS